MRQRRGSCFFVVLLFVSVAAAAAQPEERLIGARRYARIWAGDSVITANLSLDLDLTKEQMRFISRTHYDIEPTKEGNLQYRDWLRDYIGYKSSLFDQQVVQTWFAQNRPELALMWMDVDFSESQLDKLEKIKIPLEVEEEIQTLQHEIMKQIFAVAYSNQQVERLIGDYYLVRDRVLRSGVASVGNGIPDMVAFRILCSRYVQKELGFTIADAQRVNELLAQYRKNKWLQSMRVEDEDEEPNFPDAKVAAIESQVLDDIQGLLNDEQWLRLQQITNQRYVKMVSPDRAIRLMGYKPPAGQAREQMMKKMFTCPADMDGVERILKCQYVAQEVAKILEDKTLVLRIVGKPSVLKRGPTQPPDLSNPVLKKLMRVQTKNPRRKR